MSALISRLLRLLRNNDNDSAPSTWTCDQCGAVNSSSVLTCYRCGA